MAIAITMAAACTAVQGAPDPALPEPALLPPAPSADPAISSPIAAPPSLAAAAAAPTSPPSASTALVITEHLLPWTPEREMLTAAYLAAHRTTALTGDPAVDTRMAPQAIVLHWTGGPTASSAWNTFAPATLSGRAELSKGGALNVGAHYLVDRDGHVERIAPEDRVVRHCIGLNHVAIGIENVGGDPTWPLTQAQVDADAALVRDIASRWPIQWLYGHSESAAIEASPVFEEKDPTYRNAKPDPGAAFMAKVRADVADLGLEGG